MIPKRIATPLAVVAILAGIALFFANEPVFHGEALWTVGIAAIVALFALSAIAPVGLVVALGAAGAGFTAYKADAFWGIVAAGSIGVWALITLIPTMDSNWRHRLGFTVAVFGVAFVSLWPTLADMSGGKVACPTYVRSHIKFGIVKGLDLQGGLRLVYTVEVDEAIRDKRNHIVDDMRHDFAVAYQIHTGDGLLTRDEQQKLDDKLHIFAPIGDVALLRIQFKDASDATKMFDDRFKGKFLRDLSQLASGEAAVIALKIKGDEETRIRTTAVNQAKETINRRVDEMGLREASVTVRDEDIIVEVPGTKKEAFDEIKDIIRKTARLEFKMVDDEGNFFGKIQDKDVPEGIAVYTENAPAGPGKTVPSQYARIEKKPNETLAECLTRFKAWTKTLQVPDDHQIGYEAQTSYDEDTNVTKEAGWRTFYLYSRADVTGDYITNAEKAVNNNGGINEVYVGLTFTPAGADRFEEVTGANVNRRFAIILDDTIDSAPVIKTKIGGGHASISMGAGGFDQQIKQAEKLELVLRSGALPAPITPSNETLIGPTLGEDSIGKGLKGAAIGSAMVLVFMVAYYRKSGIVADIAVLFNLMIQLAILASFGATMTLPGIAGLALTIGMAVDANVLINERIREELRAGRSVRAAVEAGYDKAWASIIDGHVTVFISGLILAQYGTGPVKGFAITLIVGIIASLFTGVFCTRIVFDWWVRGAKVKALSVGIKV